MQAIGNEQHLFLTTGKIGTTSLVNVNGFDNFDVSKIDSVESLIQTTFPNATIFVVLRNPVDRFYKGLFQLFITEMPLSFRVAADVLTRAGFAQAFTGHLLSSKFWDGVIERYLLFSNIEKGVLVSAEDYHFGPWLDKFNILAAGYTPVHLNHLTRLLTELQLENARAHSNKTTGTTYGIDDTTWESIYNTFKEAINKSTIYPYIDTYLTRDVIAYQKLMQREYYDSNR